MKGFLLFFMVTLFSVGVWAGPKVPSKPSSLLIYYGYPNSYNSAVNQWNNEKVAQDMARFELIVLGDGVQDPSHADYSNMRVIVDRVQELRSDVLIFGYVTSNQSQTNFTTKVGQWNTCGVDGIFMDESGYDYGVSRQVLNAYLDIVHSQSLANIAFVNAWNMDNIIGTAEDVSYPNSTWNPNSVASNLTEDDFYLLESFAINTLSYTGSTPDGYETLSGLKARIEKACVHRDRYGINLVGVAVISNTHASGQDLFDFAYTAALMASLDVFGSSDHYYGASTAQVARWVRPSGHVRDSGYLPSLQVDVGDVDVLLRMVKRAKLELDFSTSAQDSTITLY